MIVDTSVIVAALKEEPDAPDLLACLAAHRGPRRMASGSMLELHTVVVRYGYATREVADQLLKRLQVEIVPFDADMAQIGATAYEEYGRGTGHRAKLNFGDCFAYALAKATGEPLLFKGNDFSQTDITPALRDS